LHLQEKQEGHTEESGAQDGSAPKPADVEYLTVEDEQSLVTYYLQQLTRLCKMFKFPVNVESTAMTYLKRFYLRNTCMDYHPKNVMYVPSCSSLFVPEHSLKPLKNLKP
jgi:cyclin H